MASNQNNQTSSVVSDFDENVEFQVVPSYIATPSEKTDFKTFGAGVVTGFFLGAVFLWLL